MPVTNTTQSSSLFTGNGATTAFATGFHFLNNADVQVILVTTATGAETVQTITTHYTITGAGTSAGGTVTFLTAPTAAQKVKIIRNITLDQQTDYVEGTAFPATTHETIVDRLTMISQQLNEKINRTPLLPASSVLYPLVLPDGGATKAGYLLRWNDTDGTTLEAASPVEAALTTSLTATDGGFIVGDGTGFVVETTSTARTSLGLGTMATQAASGVAITGGTVTGITDITVADGGTGASTAADARTNLGVVIGTDVQAYDAELAAIAGLTSAANKGITFTGAGTASTYDLTAAALTVLDDATVGAMVDTLGGATSTGTGGIARATSPTFVTPVLGAATATSVSAGTLVGTTSVTAGGNATAAGQVIIKEDSDDGAHAVTITVPALAGDYTLTLPTTDGASGELLQTDGSGVLSWAAAGAASAGGSTTQVQYNNAGALDGEAGFTFDGTGTTTTSVGAIIGGNSTASGFVRLLEDTDNGSNYMQIQAPAAVTTNTTLTLPDGAGSASQVLTTDGSGTLSWATPSSGAWVKISATTASASASVAFTGLTATYMAYMVVYDRALPATDAVNLHFQASTDGGSTYYSTNEYAYAHCVFYPSDGSLNNHGATASATFQLTGVTATTVRPGNAANEGVTGHLIIYNPSATSYGRVEYKSIYSDSAGAFYNVSGGGTVIAAADIDAIRFLFSSGNIASGIFTLYGLVA